MGADFVLQRRRLGEIKPSNRGLRFLAIQCCGKVRIPEMSAVPLMVFAQAGQGNAAVGCTRMRGVTS